MRVRSVLHCQGVDNVVPEPPELFAKRLDTFVFTHRSDTNAVQLAKFTIDNFCCRGVR